MASLGVEKAGFGYNSIGSSVRERKMLVIVLLRSLSLLATLAAALVMGLNKETKTFVVATVGTSSIKVTLTAKFQDTPANIFLVVACALATFHNILMLALEIFGKKLDANGNRFMLISILDIINLTVLSAGAASSAFMGELAKNGNTHAQWNKVCDKFEKFCNHGAGATLASFIGLALLLAVTLITNLRLRQATNNANGNASV
uniref:CASP-like protein n=1 Tax=Opuntia streptacantha TaxID=393608 RepID=A0A7C9DNF5_OPUST